MKVITRKTILKWVMLPSLSMFGWIPSEWQISKSCKNKRECMIFEINVPSKPYILSYFCNLILNYNSTLGPSPFLNFGKGNRLRVVLIMSLDSTWHWFGVWKVRRLNLAWSVIENIIAEVSINIVARLDGGSLSFFNDNAILVLFYVPVIATIVLTAERISFNLQQKITGLMTLIALAKVLKIGSSAWLIVGDRSLRTATINNIPRNGI